jgi:hypothetical protein
MLMYRRKNRRVIFDKFDNRDFSIPQRQKSFGVTFYQYDPELQNAAAIDANNNCSNNK